MKKKLNETDITNELRGASLFFAQPSPPAQEKTAETLPRRRTASSKKQPAPSTTTYAEPAVAREDQERVAESRTTYSLPESPSPAPGKEQRMEGIRKAVKQLGKEVTFCRFTQDEKTSLGDIVYTYKRNGIRTSENEIVRIAVNWLIENYRTDGQNSVLAQVLDHPNLG
jgi:hypothetical protein